MRGLLKTYYSKSNQQSVNTSNVRGSTILRQEGAKATQTQDLAYQRRGSQDLVNDPDRPKTKEEIKVERMKERERLRVARAHDRREQWLTMNANDPEFLQGFQQGALPLFHAENVKFRDFSSPGIGGTTGSVLKTSLEKSAIEKFHLYDQTEYDSNQPNNHNRFRSRDYQKETAMPIMKYTHKNQGERINDAIQGATQFSTEPLNTLLLVKPKWREHDETKWVGGKEFKSQMSKKDQGWQPLMNVSEQYPEPFIQNKVQFRDTSSVMQPGHNGLLSSGKKRRNLSQVKSNIKGPSNIFKNTPLRSPGNEEEFDESPQPKKHEVVMFDSMIPHDKTWQNRMVQSLSLRQKHHLNYSLKMRKNLQAPKDIHAVDMRAQIEMHNKQDENPVIILTQSDSFDSTPQPKLQVPGTAIISPGKGLKTLSPGYDQNPRIGTSSQKKPPLHKKEQTLTLEKVPIDIAASYLNNDMGQSYSNSWQYNVVVKAPVTYANKKFEEKEELRDSHILWEMDREKTYFRSALEKINPSKIKEQLEFEKMRRTNNGFLSLNQCAIDKTVDGGSPTKSGAATAMAVGKKITSPIKIESASHGAENTRDRTQNGFYSSAVSSDGGSPSKLMSMTMPNGFRSSAKKAEGMNHSEIKEVVKSYFDKSPSTNHLNYGGPSSGASPKNNNDRNNVQVAQSSKEITIVIGGGSAVK